MKEMLVKERLPLKMFVLELLAMQMLAIERNRPKPLVIEYPVIGLKNIKFLMFFKFKSSKL